MIYGIIIFFATLIIDLATDYRLWLKYRNVNRPQGAVNHVIGAALRTAGLALSIIFLGWWAIPMVLFVYWILMDGFFNLLTRQKWWRIGTTAKLDILQRSVWRIKNGRVIPTGKIIVVLKYVFAIGSIILYIYATN